MSKYSNWRYDEFIQVGKDYGQAAEVDVYDSSHAEFRDVDAENEAVLKRLHLSERDTLVDFGAGTGEFAIAAAKHCSKVYAVDISSTMLELARRKAGAVGVSNIEFAQSGFLNFEMRDGCASVATTSFALHHLPDFWKGVALSRIAKMLKDKGKLFIRDVVMEAGDALGNIDRFVDKQTELGGDFLREDAEGHFREEFSTYDWVMEGLLERAGFTILEKNYEVGLIGTFLCEKR